MPIESLAHDIYYIVRITFKKSKSIYRVFTFGYGLKQLWVSRTCGVMWDAGKLVYVYGSNLFCSWLYSV